MTCGLFGGEACSCDPRPSEAFHIGLAPEQLRILEQENEALRLNEACPFCGDDRCPGGPGRNGLCARRPRSTEARPGLVKIVCPSCGGQEDCQPCENCGSAGFVETFRAPAVWRTTLSCDCDCPYPAEGPHHEACPLAPQRTTEAEKSPCVRCQQPLPAGGMCAKCVNEVYAARPCTDYPRHGAELTDFVGAAREWLAEERLTQKSERVTSLAGELLRIYTLGRKDAASLRAEVECSETPVVK